MLLRTLNFLFLPAIRLMNRLSYLRKFGLLWLMSAIAIAIVLSNLYITLQQQIHTARRELEGLALAAPLAQAIQTLQQRRGLYVGFGEQQESMLALLLTKDSETRAHFSALEARLPPRLKAAADWLQIHADLAQLLDRGSAASAAESFTTHSRLVERLLMFEAAVSGEYALSLDPEIDSSYLIDATFTRLPLILENLGKIRALGTHLLNERLMSGANEVMISGLASQLRSELNFLKTNIDRASRYNNALQAPLHDLFADIGGGAMKLADVVESDITTGHLRTSPHEFFAIATAAIDSGYAHTHTTLLPTIDRLVRARISRATAILWVSIGIAAALFLVVIYLSVGAYLATIANVGSLARSAKAFAAGKLDERLTLDTRDELKQVGHSFNEMANGFSALLAARRDDEERYRSIVETALDAVVQMDGSGRVSGWNPQAEAIFGWSREEAIGRLMHDLIVPPQYRQAHIDGLRRFSITGGSTILNSRQELVALHRNGHEFPIEMSITVLQNGKKQEFSAFIRDITRDRESADLIWRQANFDALTGLPNRRMFHERLGQEMRKADREHSGLALLFIDLDRFKEINDSLGHRMGDLLLAEAVERINGSVRETDVVARWGGDEFVVAITGIDNNFGVERVTQHILGKLAEPFRLENEIAYLSASIGITLYPGDAKDIEELLKQADQAMYRAKNTGRNRFCYFTPELQKDALARLRLINDLREALLHDQFRVHFQPIVGVTSGRIEKAEALIRWQHPERGNVPPGEFIAVAEQTGLILPIGAWVLDAVCAQQAAWLAAGMDSVPVAVNLSPSQFARGNLVEVIEQALARHAIAADHLELELTESLVMQDPEGAAHIMEDLVRRGLRLSLDDFGTGYSSLAYLQRFPFHSVKIDRAFIKDLTRNPGDAAIATAVIAMAHRLDLGVVAEGVEDDKQLAYLRGFGCDQIQGFHFSPPLPADRFAELVRSGKCLDFDCSTETSSGESGAAGRRKPLRSGG